MEHLGKLLRSKLEERRGLLIPGAADALSARVIAGMGFEAVYVTGAGVTNVLLGMPDLGFISLPELAQQTSAMREVVELPIIVDADTALAILSTFATPFESWSRPAPTRFKSKIKCFRSAADISAASK